MSTLGVLLVIPEVYLCAVQCGLVLYFLHFVLVGSTFLILVVGVGETRAGYCINTKYRRKHKIISLGCS